MTHQRRLSPLILAGLLLMLGGCTMLGPDFKTPEAQVPQTWGEQDNELFQKPSK